MKNNSTIIGPGKFKGRLFDIGKYPGAIYEPESDNYVYGTLLSLTKPAENFRIVDDYEGFGVHHTQPFEFIREIIKIESDSKLQECWVYLYNFSVRGLQEIQTGNYINFLSSRT